MKTHVFSDVLGSHSLVGSVGGVQGAEDEPAKCKERVRHGEQVAEVQQRQDSQVRRSEDPGVKLNLAPAQDSRRQADHDRGKGGGRGPGVDFGKPFSAVVYGQN
jgi:hypothetical protein